MALGRALGVSTHDLGTSWLDGLTLEPLHHETPDGAKVAKRREKNKLVDGDQLDGSFLLVSRIRPCDHRPPNSFWWVEGVTPDT